MKVAVVALALVAGSAQAEGVWQHAITGSQGDVADADYIKSLGDGDKLAGFANQDGITPKERLREVDAAIDAYKRAADAKPTAAEPYFRIGQVLFSFYFAGCSDAPPARGPLCASSDPAALSSLPAYRDRAEQTLAAWAAAEARSPLDPRISSGFLFERAIIEAKLATPQHWAEAARDYEAIQDRDDLTLRDQIVSGNLAETYMMIGRLDDAIEMYRRAINDGGDTSAAFGLADALDRDGQDARALDLIRDHGVDEVRKFEEKIHSFEFFFVPAGERFYYLALIEEAFDSFNDATRDFRAFIASGAHPQYQARARAHIAEMQGKHPVSSPLEPVDDELWGR